MRCRGDGRDALSMYCREKVKKKNLSTYQIRRPPLREERRATGNGGSESSKKNQETRHNSINCMQDRLYGAKLNRMQHSSSWMFVQSRVALFEPSFSAYSLTLRLLLRLRRLDLQAEAVEADGGASSALKRT